MVLEEEEHYKLNRRVMVPKSCGDPERPKMGIEIQDVLV